MSDPDFVMGLFDDPEMREKGWVTTYEHAAVGKMDVFGLLFDLGDTPGVIHGPAPVVGAHSREILVTLGYGHDQIDELVEAGGVLDASQPSQDGRASRAG